MSLTANISDYAQLTGDWNLFVIYRGSEGNWLIENAGCVHLAKEAFLQVPKTIRRHLPNFLLRCVLDVTARRGVRGDALHSERGVSL